MVAIRDGNGIVEAIALLAEIQGYDDSGFDTADFNWTNGNDIRTVI
jgi:hypothetical protein